NFCTVYHLQSLQEQLDKLRAEAESLESCLHLWMTTIVLYANIMQSRYCSNAVRK
ncbi:25560_t:CDS:2, partial [Racocetra persica]